MGIAFITSEYVGRKTKKTNISIGFASNIN